MSRQSTKLAMLLTATLIGVQPAMSKTDQNRDEQAKPEKALRLWHRPPNTAAPGVPMEIDAVTVGPKQHKVFALYYRSLAQGAWKTLSFRRAADGGIVVEIPGSDVQSPGFEYYIAAVLGSAKEDGALAQKKNAGSPEVLMFASPQKPHRVLVYGDSQEARLAKRAAEHQGRLSRLEVQYSYNDFGLNLKEVQTSDAIELKETSQGNVFHQISAAYTYRLLGFLYAIRVEIAGLSAKFADFKPFEEDRSPGMYYISPSAEFEFYKFFGANVLLRFGISEEEFEFGSGASLRVGRMVGTRVDFGFEGMSHAGWQLFLRLSWDTVPYVPMALFIARTQWYAAPTNALADWGAMLAYELKVNLPAGWALTGKVGYAARDESTQGGLIAGGGVSVDF